MKKALPIWSKSYEGIQKASAAPSADDLALINQFSLEPVDADDVYVVPMKACNDQYDRSDERFPKAYLDRFAETLPGKSLMLGHNYSTEPAGRIFAAEVRKDGDGHHVHVRAYMDAADPMAGKVRKGIAKGVSIGFQPDIRTCDLDGKDYDGWYKQAADDQPCDHIRGRMYDGRKCTLTYGGDVQKVEGLEMSLVWLPCQHNAETSRASAEGAITKAEHFDALEQSPSGKGESMKELEEALARIKALEAEKAALAPLATDGEAYRKWLKEDISRLYTSMEDTAAGATLLGALADAKAADLETVRVGAVERQKKFFDPRGGADLNGAPAEKPQRRSLDDILNGVRQGGAV